MLFLLTDRHRLADRIGCDSSEALSRLPALVGEAARAGIHLVQVRERDLDARDLARLVTACLAAVAGSETRLVVNDRLDVALATGAHGVHLRGDSFPIERAKSLTASGFLVGRSVHSADEAASAAAAGASYLVFGTVFPSRSKPDRVSTTGPEQLAAVVVRVRGTPVFAIGGMTAARAAAVAASGAAGMAGIDLFLPSGDGNDLMSVAAAARTAFRQAAAPGQKHATPG